MGDRTAAARGTLLVIDDDPAVHASVSTQLEQKGYQLLHAFTGSEGLLAAARANPDVVLLDMLLPDMDGLDTCRQLRESGPIPIIMLSSAGDEIHRILGLEAGADDYLPKPFNPHELDARVRALLRRVRLDAEARTRVVERRGILVDLTKHVVTVAGQPVNLTPLEFSLLRALITHPGRVFSRQELLNTVWGVDYVGAERTVDVHVCGVRQKLIEAGARSPVVTAIRGVGYRFEE